MAERQPRFAPSLWVGHGALMAKLGVLLWRGRIDEAKQFVADNAVEMQNLTAAFKSGLVEAGYSEDGTAGPPVANVDELTPWLAKWETRNVDGDPNKVYCVIAAADGSFSVEVSGSPFVTFSVGNKGEFNPARQSEGAGSAPPVAVREGEYCNWKFDAESGGRTMRPQLL